METTVIYFTPVLILVSCSPMKGVKITLIIKSTGTIRNHYGVSTCTGSMSNTASLPAGLTSLLVLARLPLALACRAFAPRGKEFERTESNLDKSYDRTYNSVDENSV